MALDRLSAEVAEATAGRIGAQQDRLTAEDVLRREDRVGLAADPAFGGLERVQRARDPELKTWKTDS